jgi:putative SOS response-associated peptidase YedK
MCGRYVISSSPDVIRSHFRYHGEPIFPARYNIAPTQPVPIVRVVEGKREFALVRWGLIPHWVKDPRGFALILNARGESVLDKAAFRYAMQRRRCLFPAGGFYEWQVAGSGGKRPYFIRPRAVGPIAFAGLWETWMGPKGEELETACIVTTDANRLLAPLHDRMPVVVSPDAYDLWLDCAHVDAMTAAALIAPAPESLFEAYEISTAVNRTANDSASLIEPLAPRPAPSPPAAAALPMAPSPDAPATKTKVKAMPAKADDQLTLF